MDKDPFSLDPVEKPKASIREINYRRLYTKLRKRGIRMTKVMEGMGKYYHGSRRYRVRVWSGNVVIDGTEMSFEDALRLYN